VVGSNAEQAKANAYELGMLIAQQQQPQWVVVSGGRNDGVMAAVNQGASQAGGLTIGVLPGRPGPTSSVAPGVQVAIFTDMNNARNNIIGLSSDVVVACAVDGAGTASEVALALKNGKHVLLLDAGQTAVTFFQGLSSTSSQIHPVATPTDAIKQIKRLLQLI
jgi:uncharacterized protein (TIGR00725 family)